MAVPLLDFSRQYAYLKPDLDEAIIRVLRHGGFILGPEVKQLEERVASLCDVPYAIGVASGTDALLLALHAVGVRAGDEVIVPDFSFFSTAGVVHRLGARPVFVDIESDTYNIDPNLIEAAVTSKTKAIIPVHLFGQLADMDPILEIARHHDLTVIEDAAQAIGAEYKGHKAGSIGDFGCFSFYPTKNLGAAGDAGIITVKNKEHYELCRMLRVHGARRKYYHDLVGCNSRLDTLQAAVLLVKLPHLQRWSRQRVAHAGAYDAGFAELTAVRTPVVKSHSTFHIYNQYTIAVPNRDEVVAGLRERGIGCMIYYPVPFHKQPCFAHLEHPPDAFSVSNKASAQVLSVPIYPELTEAERREVIDAIRELVG